MIRSILVALDEGSDAAQRLAIALAVERGGSVSGMAVLDLPWLTRGEAVPAGGAYYKFHRDTERLHDRHRRNEAIRNRFVAAAASAGILSETGEIEGDPGAMLVNAAEIHDLVVIGHGASFHPGDKETLAGPVQHLVEAGLRPVLVAPDRAVDPGRILVATDGSAPAWRAIHLFALLGLAEGRDVTVISVAGDHRIAQGHAVRAARLLGLHGARPQAVGIASRAHPAEIVSSQVDALGAGILVMGAHGHRGLGEWLFGSTMHRLLQACPAALFIHR